MNNNINKNYRKILKNRNVGISLITLIITIIVILILATIVIFTGLRTPESAQFAKFTQDVDNVQMAVTNKFADLKAKHAIEKESRTDEQIYLEIASGADQEMYKFMGTTIGNYTNSSEESTGIQNIDSNKAKTSIGMELPKVREYNTAWYVTKEGRVFNANGYTYNKKTYFDAKTYYDQEIGSNSTKNANRAKEIYDSAISKGIVITAEISEKGEDDIEKNEMQTLVSQVTAENYGDSVNFTSANGEDDWKIFYNDGTNVYLIAGDFVSTDKINITESGMTIAKSGYTLSGQSSMNYHFAADFVEQLTNPLNWSNFANGISETTSITGATAVGAPTLDMWIASWNEKGYTTLYSKSEIKQKDSLEGNTDYTAYYIGIQPNPTTTAINLANTDGGMDRLYFPHRGVYTRRNF